MAALSDEFLQRYHDALRGIINTNSQMLESLYSERDDVTLANPFGPVARGRAAVVERMRRAASNYRDGEVSGFDQVVKYETPQLAYLVEVERYEAKVGGGEKLVPISLRVTSVFRPEDDGWRLVHRHADPITTEQSPESVVRE